jgi:hypothetical protein
MSADDDGTLPATTFEPFPERVDLLGLVLSLAGLGALAGSLYGAVRAANPDARARYAQLGSFIGAGFAFGMFLFFYVVQGLL